MAQSIVKVNSRQDSSMEAAAEDKDGTSTNVPRETSLGKRIWDKLGLNVGTLVLMLK